MRPIFQWAVSVFGEGENEMKRKWDEIANRVIKSKKGVALIWAYLVSAALLTSLMSSYDVMVQDTKFLGNDKQAIQAFYLAEAGLDHMMANIKNGGSYADINSPAALAGIGGYQVHYNSVDRVIESTGTLVSGVQKQVAAKLDSSVSTPPGVSGALTVSNLGSISGAILSITGSPNRPGLAYVAQAPEIGSSVQISGNGVPAENPINPLAMESLDSNENLQSAQSVLQTTADALVTYTRTTFPTGPLSNEIWYAVAPNPGCPHGTGAYNLDGGSGVLIADGCNVLELTGTFTGLIIVKNVGTVKLSSVHIAGAMVFTSSEQAPGSINVLSQSSITYDQAALQNLPTIQGAGYGQTTYKMTWTDGSNTVATDGGFASRLTPALEDPDPVPPLIVLGTHQAD